MTRPKLLLILDDAPYSADFPSPLNRPQLPPQPHPQKQTTLPNPPFDSSIPLTIIVLLTALFFMAFFSLYVRCFSAGSDPSPNSSSRQDAPVASSKVGADPDVVRSLPVVGYGGGGGGGPGEWMMQYRQSDCAVCLSDFEEGETVKVIPLCRHVFHPECVDTWLSSHVSCPVCRSVRLL